jgi:hypothetical protein
MMNIRLLVSLVSLATITALAQPAFACGEENAESWYGTTDNVKVYGRGAAATDAETIRNRAVWLYRIQALADQPGDQLTWDYGYVEACNANAEGGQTCIEGHNLTLAQAFRLFATVNGSTQAQVRAARTAAPTVYTIQLAASRNPEVAERLAYDNYDIADLETGFTGVYADLNEDEGAAFAQVQSRVASDGSDVYEVTLGVFFSRSDASNSLIAVHNDFPRSFVRPL